MKKLKIDLKIIGIVNSPYKNSNKIPIENKQDISEIVIHKEFEKGLKDIEGFSHLHIFYWFHKSKKYNLQVTTPLDEKLHRATVTEMNNIVIRAFNRAGDIGKDYLQSRYNEGKEPEKTIKMQILFFTNRSRSVNDIVKRGTFNKCWNFISS